MKPSISRLLLPFLAILFCCVTSVAQESESVNIPSDWKKVNAEGFFTFYLPPKAWAAFKGLDEFSREYRIGRMRFAFAHRPMGVTSYERRGLKFGKGFEESVISVGGKKAYLFNYVQNLRGRKRYNTELYIGDFPNGDVELWITADSWRPKDLEIAKKIFRTVEFVKA
jgi:hypothetical protein